MLKIVGIILIFTSGMSIFLGKIYENKKRLNTMKLIRALILKIRNEIEFSQKPVFDILHDFCEDESNEIHDFLCDFYAKAIKSKSIKDGYLTAKSNLQANLNLTAGTIEAVERFIENLGHMAKNIELENADFTLSELDGEIQRTEENFSKTEKIYKSAGVMVSVLLIIIFI